MDRKGKEDISAEEKKELEKLAQLGFVFSEGLRAMPPHVRDKFTGHFKHRGERSRIAGRVWNFSSVILAVVKGYTPEQRRAYLETKNQP